MTTEQIYRPFLTSVEQHTGRSFQYAGDVERLLQIAGGRGMEQVFVDVVFHATFVVKTNEVMKRIGAGAEGFDVLSAQFAEGVERVSTLLRTLIKEDPEEWRQNFSFRFLTMDQQSLNHLLDLLRDLSLIKHWEVDGHPLPFPGFAPPRTEQRSDAVGKDKHVRNLIRAGQLALLLLIVLFIIDGPFTIIGWITAAIVTGLLLVVQYEAWAASKNTS